MTKFINSSGSLHLNIYIEQISQRLVGELPLTGMEGTELGTQKMEVFYLYG